MSKLLLSGWKRSGARSVGMFFALLLSVVAAAHSQCSSPANAIVAENCQAGNPQSEWDVSSGDAGDPTIQGFATDISVNQGGTIYFKVNTTAKAYTLNIYRMGYYGGQGARKVATVSPSVSLPQAQPACASDATTQLTDCGNWAVSASWQVPANATSGIYFAHLIRSDTGGDSHIVFVVRNDASTSAILYKTADESWQAYNYYGNGSFYGPGSDTFDLLNRAHKVSYNRPVVTRGFSQESNTWVFGAEFPMIEWLEQNGYDISYTTGIDAARNGSLFLNHKMIMDCGHDEYISGPERATLQAARDAGVNLAFFSGNEMFWKTRLENSIDGTNTPNRTLVCYKETLAFAKLDPQDPPTWTGTWRDPTFSPPADGGKPENALTGTLFLVNGGPDDPGNLTVQVPQADGQMRFWRNTAVANLAPGTSYSLVTGSLGFEWDGDVDNGFRPAGAFRLSTSNYVMTTDLLLDYGGTYGAGPVTHHMMMYRAPSGALVFGAGTVNFSWGLNSNHDNPFTFDNPNPDPNMQQAVVNLFADMGLQPATLQSGLVRASASTDKTAPQSIVTSPAPGTSVNAGNTITVMGTATDTGGMVAGVEVSGDGGVTWHPANGRGNWTYALTPTVVGTPTVMSRAVDDSGNLETPTSSVILNVAPQVCPCTIFMPSSTPANVDSGDPNAIEVGVKFRADADGSIIGVRFFKSIANTGAHVGHIWSSTGTLLGTATFSSESSSGWQQANFNTPVAVTANATYVISYFSPVGHYSSDSFTFETAGVDDPPLHALANGVDGQNGVYIYGPSGGFPNSSYNASNYWVDVVYTSSNTYSISGAISGYGGAGASVTLSGTETLSTTADASGNYSFDGIVNGSYVVSVNNPGVTFTPPSQNVAIDYTVATGVNFTAVVSNPLSISGNLSGGAGATVNLSGSAVASAIADASGNYAFNGLLPGSYTVTPVEVGQVFQPEAQVVALSNTNVTGLNFTASPCTCISIWPASTTPTVIDGTDPSSVEVGLKFTADSPAYISGIRFYKAATNTGTHIGHIWDGSGNLLASVTFVGESASGWQQANLSAPIYVQANTPYIVSYLAPAGHYSADQNYFANSGVNSPPLHALQSGIDGGNGVYVYTTSGAYPTGSYQATNYWVDIVYAAQPYTISGTIAGGGGPGATVALSGTSQATTTADVNGNYSFTGIFGGSFTVTPSNPGFVFAPGSQTVVLSQANATGVDFTTPQICPCDTIWQPSAVPALIDGGDPSSIEVGVKVHADADGYILGVRFYKAGSNTGNHIGNLWTDAATTGGTSGGEGASGSAPGSLIATANFSNESAAGWQQVLFSNPVPVVANTTYVASYFAPMGHYSLNSAAFTTAGVDSPPLHALQDGLDGGDGVFSYSPASALPTSSYNASNYWVDVIYAPTTTYTLGGKVSGTGFAGATITLGGAGTATTVTDANGNYSFNGLSDGVYTLTPSEPGILFSPASQSVTINGSHQLNVAFMSGVPSYPVSGQVTGAPGISVVLSGTTTQTTVADSNGNFSFPTVANGNYTVTPTSPGYTVAPLSQSVVVNGAAVANVNFSATVVTYSVSGTITGGAGAVVNLVGATTTTTTADSNGNYSFANVLIGSYSIVPSMPGVVFNPGSVTVVLNGTNIVGANFAVPQNCPCDTIWQPSTVPTTADLGDPTPVEVGVKFRADADAYITAIRFYKSSANTGTHVGHLWTESGTLLGTATFINESVNGWQQVFFANPIPVSANTTYVASYADPAGHYSADTYYFTSAGVDSPPLHALADGVDGPNGVFSLSPNTFPSQTFNENATNYWVDVVYTPTTTYSISGTIAGPGGPGGSVALSGAATATAATDPSGNFSFNGLANGTYAVTPSQSGYKYTPATLNATINNAHVLGLSFSSSGASYSISGTINGPGGPGATVSLSGTSTATTTADPSGNYSFTALPDGSYTVAVANTGYIFTPASQAVTVNGANITAGFSSVAQTYTLSGNISGVGGPGATVTLSGVSSAKTTADSSGNYSFASLANGAYSVSVTNTGYVFTPPSQAVTISGANATATFTSVAQTYTLSGTISGPGGSGATVTLTGPVMATTFASGTGAYSFTGLANGVYAVSAAKAGYVFSPGSQAVTINGANATAAFSSAVTYTISGTITGAGAAAAVVSLTGAATATTVASATGTYSFTGVVAGAYTITPSSLGYLFTPTSRNITVSNANVTANFTSIAQNYTISGTISGAITNGVTVKLTGTSTATTTTNAAGAYSFTKPNGTYTITPSATGYAFVPPTQTVTILGTNVTAAFSSIRTYTISGTITGAGGPGATVSLSGSAGLTAIANNSGVYSLSGVGAGTYTITPTNPGYLFTPANRSITVSNSNLTENFSSAIQTYTISGSIQGAVAGGVTVRLTGSTNATTTTNSAGTYSFTEPNGTYTVTPSATGYVFSPGSQSVTVSGANVTAGFTSGKSYTISGIISGAGGQGATLTLSGAANATTAANFFGQYSFAGLGAGNYTITPANSGYAFTPGSLNVTIGSSNLTENFNSAVQNYTISGTITGPVVSGITVRLTGSANASTTTNAAGAYAFSEPNGRYTVTPSLVGYVFNPASQAVTVNGSNVGANFSSTAATYAITGTITGTGARGATVTLSGASISSTTANSSGGYSFSGLSSGSYTVTPTNPGHTFSPARQAVNITAANATANFSSR